VEKSDPGRHFEQRQPFDALDDGAHFGNQVGQCLARNRFAVDLDALAARVQVWRDIQRRPQATGTRDCCQHRRD